MISSHNKAEEAVPPAELLRDRGTELQIEQRRAELAKRMALESLSPKQMLKEHARVRCMFVEACKEGSL